MDELEIKSRVKETIDSKLGNVSIFNIQKLRDLDLGDPNKLPYSHRILLENLLRNLDGKRVKIDHLLSICQWDCKSTIMIIAKPTSKIYGALLPSLSLSILGIATVSAAVSSSGTASGGRPARSTHC